MVLVSGILVRFADQAKTSMILAGVSRRMAGWPGFTRGSAEDLHTVYIVPAKHLQRLAWNWTWASHADPLVGEGLFAGPFRRTGGIRVMKVRIERASERSDSTW